MGRYTCPQAIPGRDLYKCFSCNGSLILGALLQGFDVEGGRKAAKAPRPFSEAMGCCLGWVHVVGYLVLVPLFGQRLQNMGYGCLNIFNCSYFFRLPSPSYSRYGKANGAGWDLKGNPPQ